MKRLPSVVIYFSAHDINNEYIPYELAYGNINLVCLFYLYRLKLGDTLTMSALPEVKSAKQILVLPFKDSIEGISGDIHDVFIKPYFDGKLRPVKKNDIFVARGGMRAVEFKVVDIDTGDDLDYGLVSPDTEIISEGDPLGREEDERLNEIGYEDIGGCSRQLANIRELVELPLRHPQIFRSVGIPPPRGVLMYGPPGSG